LEEGMTKSRIAFMTLCILVAWAAAGDRAQAQPYPSGPVKVISDSAPGSAPDVILRIVSERLGQLWGQQVIVMNQPGAGGAVAARAAAGAMPNGSTLFMAVSSAFVTMKGAASNIPIEVPRDFAPISIVGEQPMFITITSAAGINTLPALIAAAKQKPGEITYAVSGVGRQSHLTGEMLQRRAGIKLLMVPYSGGPSQALGDLMGGRVQMLIEGGTALVGAMQSGKLRALAVGSDSRLAEFPDLPTVAETIPNFRAAGWMAMVAPAGTPEPIVRKVSNDLRTVLTNPEVRGKLAAVGSYVRPTSPEDTTKFILNEQRTWAPVLNELSHSK
jgi:tripartite-type tricarboxylate transporter receptor subunit TctC